MDLLGFLKNAGSNLVNTIKSWLPASQQVQKPIVSPLPSDYVYTPQPTTSSAKPIVTPPSTTTPIPTVTPTTTTPVVDTAQKVTDTLANSYQKLIDQYDLKSKEFDAKNPFLLDEVMAQKRTAVSARLDPYYTQTLDDYIHGVDVQRTRSLADEKTVLADTNSDVSNFAGKTKDVLTEAIKTSGEGMADSGLFFSGLSLRNEGQATNAANTSVADYTTTAGRVMRNASLNTSRTLADLATTSGQKVRDINQEKYYNTEAGANKEAGLAQAQHQLERNQYIGAPFSSNSISNLPAQLSSYLG